MSEKVAIIGSRQGADLEHVLTFVRALYAKQPDTILVSGGANGVDIAAEQLWAGLGGRVNSYRPTRLSSGDYGIELWQYGGYGTPSVYVLVNEPEWADYSSAAFYRNLLIAEAADRVVGFQSARKSRGTAHTLLAAGAEERPTYEYVAAA